MLIFGSLGTVRILNLLLGLAAGCDGNTGKAEFPSFVRLGSMYTRRLDSMGE